MCAARLTGAAAFLLAIPGTPLAAIAQRADTIATVQIDSAISHTRFVRNGGPWIVNVLRVNLRAPSVQIRHVRANESVFSRERVSDMVRRREMAGDTVLAAINADFFDLTSGANENNQLIDGEWWRGLTVTDSPFDTFDNVHAQFALDSLRRPLLDRFVFRGTVIADGRSAPLAAPPGVSLHAQTRQLVEHGRDRNQRPWPPVLESQNRRTRHPHDRGCSLAKAP